MSEWEEVATEYVRGRVQRQGDVVHIVAHAFERLDVRTDRLIRVSHDFR